MKDQFDYTRALGVLNSNSPVIGTPTRKQIPEWMDRLNSEIGMLEQRAEGLSPVLHQKSNTNEVAGEVAICELASQLRSFTRRIQNINELLNDIEL